jgi:hypothetical protein
MDNNVCFCFASMLKIPHSFDIMKECLNIDGQQFHQYQQPEQSPLTSNH